jgi:hypothetical protein
MNGSSSTGEGVFQPGAAANDHSLPTPFYWLVRENTWLAVVRMAGAEFFTRGGTVNGSSRSQTESNC